MSLLARTPSIDRFWPITSRFALLILIALPLPRDAPFRLLFVQLLFPFLAQSSVDRVVFACYCVRCAVADFPLPLVVPHHLLALDSLQELAASSLACPAEAFNFERLESMSLDLAPL